MRSLCLPACPATEPLLTLTHCWSMMIMIACVASAPLGHGMFGSMDLAISQLQSMPSGFLDPASQSHGNLPELGTAPTAPQRNAAPSGFSR